MYTNSTVPVTSDRDAVWIAAKHGDVLIDPVESRNLIHQTEIAPRRIVERRKET